MQKAEQRVQAVEVDDQEEEVFNVPMEDEPITDNSQFISWEISFDFK